PQTRLAAEHALRAAGPAAKDALPALRGLLLVQATSYATGDAPAIFVRIGGAGVVEEVVRLIPAAREQDRGRLTLALAEAGPASAAALRRLAGHDDLAVRAAAVGGLGTLARTDP